MKHRNRFSLILLFSLIVFMLLFSFSKGQAQTSAWQPSWVDLADSGLIQMEGFDPQAVPKSDPALSPEPESNGLLDTISQFFASLTRSLSAPASLTDGWVTVFSDDLEGAFPSAWNVFDNDGTAYGTYYWGQRDCRPSTGSYSAWAIGAGTDGSLLSCGTYYPNETKSWMIYGPFSLADATDAEFRFDFRLNSELYYDLLFVGASINGINFYGESASGIYDWNEKIFDLTDVYTLGNLAGQSQVWVVLAFQADDTINNGEGAYVDNVEVLKYTLDDVTATPTFTLTPLATRTSTPTSTTTILPILTATSTSTPTATRTVAVTATPTHTALPEGLKAFLPMMLNRLYNGPTPTPTQTLPPTVTFTPTVTPTVTKTPTVTATSAYAVPLDGNWSGTTSQGSSMSMSVVSGGTEIEKFTISVSWGGLCGVSYSIRYFYDISINNGSFYQSTYDGTWIRGTFDTPTTADGTFTIIYESYYPYYCKATATGSWAAVYAP